MPEETRLERQAGRRGGWLDGVRGAPRRRPRLEEQLLGRAAAAPGPSGTPVAEILDALVDRLAAEQARTRALEAELREVWARTGHVLFVPSPSGYLLTEAQGPPPRPGTAVDGDGDGRAFVVARVGPSPLPGDRRRCAFLEPA